MTEVAPQRLLRVVIVDDEALIRSGFAMILGTAPDLDVVATVAGADAVSTVRRLEPDAVLLDVRMPDVDGLTVLRELKRLPRPPHVAMLTTFDTDEYLGEALHAGAGGFLLKDTEPDMLIRSVRALATGAGCLSESVLRRLRTDGSRKNVPSAVHAVGALSERERRILALLGHGMSNAEIGTRLLLSTSTVKDHVSVLLTKLGVSNRVQAAVVAERAGLLTPEAS
ncbi:MULTISPECIES: response regulator [unclassified Streptomyces]|uniref:response regulator n=1 Tax=unclassified Streptomyces TaxID=2593676 RepID=UPI0022B7319C|nr:MULTISPECIES: response regulator transcription factor [unclassified Streptomyces]MCZ7414347.1 response regulator transcription factor [Streptomyces sp. WMMC897]MCZ7431302.1 response regulator transcription factor [Streptomyces sp. WMMC1477]